MKFVIKTLGCKVNQSESEELANSLMERGFLPAASLEDADLTIINTCTVTAVADAKARQLVSKALKSTGGKVIVTGCGVDNPNSGLEKFIKNVEYLPRGPVAAGYIPSVLGSEILRSRGAISSPPRGWNISTPRHPSARTRPFLKIQDGCSHHCSYCIVPLVRGESQSIPLREVVKKAKVLLERGYKEIVLTGVDIGAYKSSNLSLAKLIKQILALQDGFRIRLSSIEPQSLDEQFISYFAGEERICSHIHLPLQSGSDRVLKLMNRPYNVEYFKELAAKLKCLREGIAITTDIIVGFPGESEGDFEATKALVQEVGFARTHIFRYSPRQSTDAAGFNKQVSAKVKKERAGELSLIAKNLSEKYKSAQVGKIAEVLIERPDGKYLKGTSSNYCPVYVEDKVGKGELVKVAVGDYKEERLFAKLV